MARSDAYDRLIAEGTRLLVSGGFHATGIKSVLQAAGVPSGSFFYYFPSKEAFALEVLGRYRDKLFAFIDGHLGDTSRPPLDRIRNYLDAVAALYESQGCQDGCLIGNMTLELAGQSEPFRVRLEETFSGWQSRVAACLGEAQSGGQLAHGHDVEGLANFFVNSLEGAVLRMKSLRSADPVRLFANLFVAVAGASAV